MNIAELRATLALAGVFGLRMLGMFLILPVFVLYATDLPGATPALMGLALGIYGLTQGLLQIPLGWLSDRLGRKPVIAAGLVLFGVGSAIAATAPDIGWTIVGRAVQGMGAVAAALTALLADVTRDGVRTRAMAVVGVTIGVSFGVSMVAGPLLADWVGVRGIFWITAGLALAAIAVVLVAVPAESNSRFTEALPREAKRDSFVALFRNATLVRLFLGIFALHFTLTAVFVAVPQLFEAAPQLAGRSHAWVYLPVLLVSVAFMAPMVMRADDVAWRRPLLVANLGLLLVAMLALAVGHGNFWLLVVALLGFFIAFNFLEAYHPAAVSQAAPSASRGAALGVYASSQFLGAFAGGTAGGLMWGLGGATAVFAVCAVLLAFWAGVLERD